MGTTLDQAVAKIMKDQVATVGEGEWLARLSIVRGDPSLIPAKLDQYEQQMTPALDDRYAAFKAALPSGGLGALAILAGSVPVRPRTPDWYPPTYDLGSAGRAVTGILQHQGQAPESFAPGAAASLDIWDVDLTLKKTDSPVFLKSTTDPTKVLLDPQTGRILYLGVSSGGNKDFSVDLARVEADPRFAGIDWTQWAPDFRSFGDPEPLLRADFIKEDLDTLLAAQSDPLRRSIICTNRSDDLDPAFLMDDLLRRNVRCAGALCMNNPAMAAAIGLGPFHGGQRKAVSIAAAITAYGPENIKHVRYYDDTDANQIAAMQLLPKLFPNIRFEFIDIIHSGGRYRQHTIAVSRPGTGELVNPRGKPLSIKDRDTYSSANKDGPLPFNPIWGTDLSHH
jgi:hypothetical protein